MAVGTFKYGHDSKTTALIGVNITGIENNVIPELLKISQEFCERAEKIISDSQDVLEHQQSVS